MSCAEVEKVSARAGQGSVEYSARAEGRARARRRRTLRTAVGTMMATSVHRTTAHSSGRGRRWWHEQWAVDWEDARDRLEAAHVALARAELTCNFGLYMALLAQFWWVPKYTSCLKRTSGGPSRCSNVSRFLEN